MKTIGIQIISFERSNYLFETLKSINDVCKDTDYYYKVCVLDQSNSIKDENGESEQDLVTNIVKMFPNVFYLPIKENLGQRGATNVVFNSGFYNDCDYVVLSDHDNIFKIDFKYYCEILDKYKDIWCTTGYHSPEHDIENIIPFNSQFPNLLLKQTARAGHMVFRKEDFISMMPCDLKIGNSDPMIGLDWYLTHWCSKTPYQNGYSNHRKDCIACLPGGAYHIGKCSTWQNEIPEEYTEEEIEQFKNFTQEDLKNHKYTPRHVYIKEKYWYEDETQPLKKEIKQLTDNDISNLLNNLSKLDEKLQEYCLKRREEIKDKPSSEHDIIDVLINNFPSPTKKDNRKIIAFNYIWPAYGIIFLEDSIESIINDVEEYWLFLNVYSYAGVKCDENNVDYIMKICKKYGDKVKVFINNTLIRDQLELRDNFKYYVKLCYNLLKKQKKENITHLLLIHTDEIYFSSQHIFKDLLEDKKSYSFQPLTYFHDPLWKISPDEDYNRISYLYVDDLREVNGDVSKLKYIKATNLNYLHMSYVLSEYELRLKLQNWGHRFSFNEESIQEYLRIFVNSKSIKTMKNLYPINSLSHLYKNLVFDKNNDYDLRLKLAKKFYKYLVDDKKAGLFDNCYANIILNM